MLITQPQRGVPADWLSSQQMRLPALRDSHCSMASVLRSIPRFCSSAESASAVARGFSCLKACSNLLAYLFLRRTRACSGVRMRPHFVNCWNIFHAVRSLSRSRCLTSRISRPSRSSASACSQTDLLRAASRSAALVEPHTDQLLGVSSQRSRQQVSDPRFFFFPKNGAKLEASGCGLAGAFTSQTSGSSCRRKSSGMMESRVIRLAARTMVICFSWPKGTVTWIRARGSMRKAFGCSQFLSRQKKKWPSVGRVERSSAGVAVNRSSQNSSSLVEASRKVSACAYSSTYRQKLSAFRVNCLVLCMNHFFLQNMINWHYMHHI